MTRSPKSDLDFLKDHLDLLLTAGETATKIESSVYNTFGVWTTLKLICVAYWQRVYSNIIPEYLRGLRMQSMAYVDVMAGSGLNLVASKYWVGGSTILACTVPKKKFDYVIAIEKHASRASALEKRLKALRSPRTFDVVCDEADSAIRTVMRDLQKKRAHFLAFVDYQGLKGFSSKSMELLLQAPCDILFTFFPNVKRAWARERELCRPLFGNLVDKAEDYDDCLERWIQSLQEHREFIYPFTIDSGEGYHYYLVLLTRRTKGGSPYTKAADYLSARILRIAGDFAKTALSILAGEQTQIDQPWR